MIQSPYRAARGLPQRHRHWELRPEYAREQAERLRREFWKRLLEWLLRRQPAATPDTLTS